MRLILRPLFEADIPADFIDILKTKLLGREIKEGERISIDILGKHLDFEVVYAEPKILKVRESTRVEISSSPVSCIELEFDAEIKELISFSRGFVVVFEKEVLIINQKGHKIFNKRFENLKEVEISGNTVAVVYDEKKLALIHVS
ncbi:DUF6849 domain-containing protein [Thermococcus sp.]